MRTASSRPGPRERLLDAAQRLSYTHGMNVGVDALLTEADVARRSLYEHFGGKDGLLTEVLRRSAAEDLARLRAAMDAAGRSPRRRLLAIFDYLGDAMRQPDFRGCRYLAADLSLTEPNHPAHTVAAEYRRQLRRLLREELARLGHPEPTHAAEQLHLLMDGALAAGAVRPGDRAARTARELANAVLAV